MMWKYHVDKFAECRYAMILDRDLIIALVLKIKFYKHTIVGGVRQYKGFMAPTINLKVWDFKATTKIYKDKIFIY